MEPSLIIFYFLALFQFASIVCPQRADWDHRPVCPLSWFIACPKVTITWPSLSKLKSRLGQSRLDSGRLSRIPGLNFDRPPLWSVDLSAKINQYPFQNSQKLKIRRALRPIHMSNLMNYKMQLHLYRFSNLFFAEPIRGPLQRPIRNLET